MSKKNKNRQQNHLVQQGVQNVTHFAGPIPPPTILAEYDRIFPGAAERIVKMAENQSAHRIELEKAVIHSNNRKSQLGQVFAFVIAIAAIIAGSIVAMIGKDIESYVLGGVISGGTIVSVVGLFLRGTHESKKEREKRRTELLNLDSLK